MTIGALSSFTLRNGAIAIVIITDTSVTGTTLRDGNVLVHKNHMKWVLLVSFNRS